MNELLKLAGLVFLIWLAIFYVLEVLATMNDPYHNSGGPAIMAAAITAFIAYSWIRKALKKR
jgi:hypothetical protein